MPVDITRMFPYLIPPDIQGETDKQTQLYEGVYNWLVNIKDSLLRGEDDDQLFRAPKTPAYRRKKGRLIKPIPEEVENYADNTFDISSSSMQSSVSSFNSDVPVVRSLRTAAMKASLQIKTQVNVNLGAKIRQPGPGDGRDVQSSVASHSSDNSFPPCTIPPSKKMCLDRPSTICDQGLSDCIGGKPVKETSTVAAIDNISVAFDDSDDILLSEISSKCQTKRSDNELTTGTVFSFSASGSAQVASSSCRQSEASSKSERGHGAPRTRRNLKSTRSTRGHSKVLKKMRKTLPKEILNRQSSLAKGQELNIHAYDLVEDPLMTNTEVKRIRKDTVSAICDGLPESANDPKLQMGVFVSLLRISVADYALDKDVSMSKGVAVVDAARNVTVTKVNDFENEENGAVTDFNESVSNQNGTLTYLNDSVVKQNSAMTDIDVSVTEQNDATDINADAVELEVAVTEQDVVASKQDSPAAVRDCNAEVGKKRRTKSGQRVNAQNYAENIGKPILETVTEYVTNERSETVTRNMASENTENMLNVESLENVGLISEQSDDTLLNFKDATFSVNNSDEKKNKSQTSVKSDSEYSTPKENLEIPNNNAQSFVLNNTWADLSSKKLSPVALADISNTMNTSANIRDNYLKDFKKTPQTFSSTHITSTPWSHGSSNLNGSMNWDCRVMLSSQKMGSVYKKQTPACRSPVIFSPYAKESVKNRVAKFENLNTLVEVTDENVDPVAPPASVRVTRTKTRAMAAAAAAAAKSLDSDISVCDNTRKNCNAAQNTARKSLKRAMRVSAAKMKREFTPNSSRDESKLLGVLTSSIKKYNIMMGLDTFLPRVNKGPTTVEQERKKEEEQRRQKERAEEACRKREIMLNAKALEKKRRNEEKTQKVAEKREAQQREVQERRQRLEREREEKMVRVMQTRDEKLREEQLVKRLQAQHKVQEVEERRRQEEAVRLARLREQEEQEVRRKEQLEKERATEEKAVAREQALLQKQKGNATFTSQPGPSKSNKQETLPLNQTYSLDEEVTSYKISDVGANSDDDLTIKHTVPKWARSYQKAANCYSEFMVYTYIPQELVGKQFGYPEDPDLTNLLGLTAQQVAHYRRKSSMFPPQEVLRCTH